MFIEYSLNKYIILSISIFVAFSSFNAFSQCDATYQQIGRLIMGESYDTSSIVLRTPARSDFITNQKFCEYMTECDVSTVANNFGKFQSCLNGRVKKYFEEKIRVMDRTWGSVFKSRFAGSGMIYRKLREQGVFSSALSSKAASDCVTNKWQSLAEVKPRQYYSEANKIITSCAEDFCQKVSEESVPGKKITKKQYCTNLVTQSGRGIIDQAVITQKMWNQVGAFNAFYRKANSDESEEVGTGERAATTAKRRINYRNPTAKQVYSNAAPDYRLQRCKGATTRALSKTSLEKQTSCEAKNFCSPANAKKCSTVNAPPCCKALSVINSSLRDAQEEFNGDPQNQKLGRGAILGCPPKGVALPGFCLRGISYRGPAATFSRLVESQAEINSILGICGSEGDRKPWFHEGLVKKFIGDVWGTYIASFLADSQNYRNLKGACNGNFNQVMDNLLGNGHAALGIKTGTLNVCLRKVGLGDAVGKLKSSARDYFCNTKAAKKAAEKKIAENCGVDPASDEGKAMIREYNKALGIESRGRTSTPGKKKSLSQREKFLKRAAAIQRLDAKIAKLEMEISKLAVGNGENMAIVIDDLSRGNITDAVRGALDKNEYSVNNIRQLESKCYSSKDFPRILQSFTRKVYMDDGGYIDVDCVGWKDKVFGGQAGSVGEKREELYYKLKIAEQAKAHFLQKYPELGASITCPPSRKGCPKNCSYFDLNCTGSNSKVPAYKYALLNPNDRGVQQTALQLARNQKLQFITNNACSDEQIRKLGDYLILNNPKIVSEYSKKLQEDNPSMIGLGGLICGARNCAKDEEYKEFLAETGMALGAGLMGLMTIPATGGLTLLAEAVALGASVGYTSRSLGKSLDRASFEKGLFFSCHGDYEAMRKAEEDAEEALLYAVAEIGVDVAFSLLATPHGLSELSRRIGPDGPIARTIAKQNAEASENLKRAQAAVQKLADLRAETKIRQLEIKFGDDFKTLPPEIQRSIADSTDPEDLMKGVPCQRR